MKNKLLFIVASIILVILVAGCSMLIPSTEENIEPGQRVEIEIKEGMTLNQVAQLLEDKGIVENGLVFRLYVQNQQKETALLPGNYTLVTGSDLEDVLETITSGPQIVTYKLIIPEGFTVNQIQDRIAQLPFIDSHQVEPAMVPGQYDYPFLNQASSLEGFLFPKTYELTADYSASDIVELLLAQYQLETSPLDYSWAQEKGLTEYQILIIASLIEREAYIPEERELISAVIHNRLDIGMPLGIDATIRYALDKWDQELTVSDLEYDSEYNTRLYAGLIPTPICNPGLEAIKAALSPADVDYLYFVVTDEQTHAHSFSTTLEEHEQNINNSQ